MIITDSIARKSGNHGVWVDYYTGKPRIQGYQFMTNNYRRFHGMPMKRRRKW